MYRPLLIFVFCVVVGGAIAQEPVPAEPKEPNLEGIVKKPFTLGEPVIVRKDKLRTVFVVPVDGPAPSPEQGTHLATILGQSEIHRRKLWNECIKGQVCMQLVTKYDDVAECIQVVVLFVSPEENVPPAPQEDEASAPRRT